MFSQGGASTQSCDDWGNGDPRVQVKPCFHKVAHPHSHVMIGAMVVHVFKYSRVFTRWHIHTVTEMGDDILFQYSHVYFIRN